MQWTEAQWRANANRLTSFLSCFVRPMGRRERREGAALYVEGLLLPGERKSVEPMARRLGVDSQKLQQFVTDSPWEEQALWRLLRQELVPCLEPVWAWIVDETGWLKQGKHSVGVARQYCGAVGKSANCQVNVQVAVADGQTRRTRLAWLKVYLPGALARGAEALEQVWLVVDWPEGDAQPYHYWLAHLHRAPTRQRILQLSRGR